MINYHIVRDKIKPQRIVPKTKIGVEVLTFLKHC